LQRFASEDSGGFAGSGTNLYAYVGNTPTAAGDPLGLWMQWDHEDLTLEEAKACGLSDADASRMSLASGVPDLNLFSWFSNTDPRHAMPGTNYQPIIDRALQRAIAEPD